MENIVRSRITKQLDKCSSRIAELGKKEKESWLVVDFVEEECRNLKEKVAAKAKELVCPKE